jgi:hypothetical protein
LPVQGSPAEYDVLVAEGPRGDNTTHALALLVLIKAGEMGPHIAHAAASSSSSRRCRVKEARWLVPGASPGTTPSLQPSVRILVFATVDLSLSLSLSIFLTSTYGEKRHLP